MYTGGLEPGGLNFDAKIRRESTDIEDLFIGHINGMDCYARGLRAAAAMIADGTFDKMRTDRYAGFGEGLGKKFASGQASLAELAAAAAAVPAGGEKPPKSGKHERLESVFNAFALG